MSSVGQFARRVPSPRECGLPEWFTQWRGPQEEALYNLLRNTKRIKTLPAQTGFGKTLVLVAYAYLTKIPTCIVTADNGLADQIGVPFGLPTLKGRRNYECSMRDEATCEDGYASNCPHKGTVNCPSSQAEMRAATSWVVVTNYDKWTSARKFGNGMEHFEQVIFDEAHEMPHALAKAMQVTLGVREIDDLGFDFPEPSLAEDVVNWRTWAHEAREEAQDRLRRARSQLVGQSHPSTSRIREVTHFRHLAKRLATIETANPQHWIVGEAEKGYQFDPIRPGRYAEAALLMQTPSILAVSATLRPETLYACGIKKADFDFQEYFSGFDPSRSPFYYVPTMRVDKNADSLVPLWRLFDLVAARRTDRKGICHTISYLRRDDLMGLSDFAGRFLVNPKGEAVGRIIEEFKRSGPGTILVSPSVGTGYDFPMKDAEWQFIAKIPFPDSRSKIVQARQADDREYGPRIAAAKLQQIAGRLRRSQEDQGETIMGDDHLPWFMRRYEHLFSKAFLRTIKRSEFPPPPPPPLRG